MKPELDKNILIFLLSSIGLIVFPHVYHIPAAVFGFFCLLLSWRFIGIWKQNWLPNTPVIVLLVASSAALLYSQHQSCKADSRQQSAMIGMIQIDPRSDQCGESLLV